MVPSQPLDTDKANDRQALVSDPDMPRALPEPWFLSFLFPYPFFTWPSLDCHLSSKVQMSPWHLAPGAGILITLASLSLGWSASTGQRHASLTSKTHASKKCGWLVLTPLPSDPQQSFSFSLGCALIPGKLEKNPSLPVSHWEQLMDQLTLQETCGPLF